MGAADDLDVWPMGGTPRDAPAGVALGNPTLLTPIPSAAETAAEAAALSL
jgi:hypothetical protein